MKIKIIHRHFPMDQQVNPLLKEPLHVGSGVLAMFAIQAGREGKFWEVSDYLFSVAREVESIDSGELAEKFGLDPNDLAHAVKNPEVWEHLKADMVDGFKLGVTGTPTFVIEGKMYNGHIPSDILNRIIDRK